MKALWENLILRGRPFETADLDRSSTEPTPRKIQSFRVRQDALADRFERVRAGTSGREWPAAGFSWAVPAGAIRAGHDPEAALRRAFERPTLAPQENTSSVGDEKVDPHASLYGDAYDGKTLSDEGLRQVFQGSDVEQQVDEMRLRPDDIARARELGIIDDRRAQQLANRSLDVLEGAGLSGLPKEIRYTHPGPFYFEIDKDDPQAFRDLKTAMGLDPDRRASQASNSSENNWDFEALERMKEDGRLRVVDRFGQSVDIFSTTDIDGEEERLINPKVNYRSIDYEPHPDHGDEKRTNALNGDKVMIEAWNHDLSRPEPGTIYEVPSYEMPRFNEGETVDIHSDDTSLWRYETLKDPGPNGRGRVGHVSGEVNFVQSNEKQVEARLKAQSAETPDADTLAAALKEHQGKRGWARTAGMEYIRYQRDQTPAGNQAMVDAGMRDPNQGVPYFQSENRYNGGHLIAASLGGMGEGMNVTAQAEGNNQDRFARVQVNDPAKGVTTLNMNETWHDYERHVHNLTQLESTGLTVAELEEQGIKVPPAIKDKYGQENRLRFEVEMSIRPYYEDEASLTEDPSTRHTREVARFTGTRLRHPETGEILGELLMADYNLGASDEDYGEKIQLLFDRGFLDHNGGYANDADMGSLDGLSKPEPDVSGAGTINDILPTRGQLRDLLLSDEFQDLWGPNVPRPSRNGN